LDEIVLRMGRGRASRLASGRNHISVDESLTGLSVSGLSLDFFIPLSPLSLSLSLSLSLLLFPFRRLGPLRSVVPAARSDDALKLKTLEMGHSRHLSPHPISRRMSR